MPTKSRSSVVVESVVPGTSDAPGKARRSSRRKPSASPPAKSRAVQPRGRQLDATQWREVYDSLDEHQRVIFDKIHRHYRGLSANELQRERQLGQMAVEAADNSTYGDNFVGTISRLLGVRPSTLYKRMQLYNTFTEDEYAELMSWKNPVSQRGLTVSHLDLMVSVAAEHRMRLLKEAVDKNWTFDTLRAQAKSYKPEAGARRNSGRKVVVKRTVPEKLTQLSDLISPLKKCAATWSDPEHGMLTTVEDLPREALDPHWIDGIVQALTSIEQVTEELQKVSSNWRKAVEYLRRCFTPPTEPSRPASAGGVPVGVSAPRDSATCLLASLYDD